MLFLLWFYISAACASLYHNNWDRFTENFEPTNLSSLNLQERSFFNSGMIEEWTPIRSTISPGNRQYFTFPVNSSYSRIMSSVDMLVFLSGNVNTQAPELFKSYTELEVAVYYTFDESVLSNITETGSLALFQAGYFEALALRPLDPDSNSTEYSNLYLVVDVYNTSSKSAAIPSPETQSLFWNYTLSISQYDLVFQWDNRAWIELVDSDYDSALLVTGNVTQSVSNSNYSIYDTGLYDLFLYSYDHVDYFDSSLTHSLGAIQNGPFLATSANNDSATYGYGSNNSTGLAIQKSITVREGSVKEQFHITGLNASTTYVVYLTKRISDNQRVLSSNGGVLFSKSTFTTLSDNSCSLIFGLDFCDGVAYSVPTSSLAKDNKTAIAIMYDEIAKSLYANFSKALQIIPCDTELDAKYSPLRSCDDCADAYRNWLCAVSIPRCTTLQSEYFIHRKKDDNRNDYLNQQIQPLNDYFEVLPCIDMCYSLVTDCPSDFQFSCPSKKSHSNLFYLSYNVYKSDQPFDTCNYVGSSKSLHIIDG
ncbi:LAME_0F19306g1_1 [Lachancea meyersii CBS 8951]|uniref:LAME_0F19306g1_1 n=1 Tax=Lachancea meyersii CBS 8951 TaxID=1266667 RepID=A0A1G4K1B0_9SACH|nr:LAME_0F19306g1_1 [Lachancea meyersii CBS 8951]